MVRRIKSRTMGDVWIGFAILFAAIAILLSSPDIFTRIIAGIMLLVSTGFLVGAPVNIRWKGGKQPGLLVDFGPVQKFAEGVRKTITR